jgi:ADP-dependent phosphofructokinase/glucokinase
VNDSGWRRRYEAALERATERAEIVQREERRIACAFTANVDRVATLDRVLLDRLFADRVFPADAPRVRRAETVDALLLGIAQCIAAGDGIDLPLPEALQDWLLARMGDRARMQVGGTGAQAAATLATLGFPVLLHLTGRSPQQIAVLPHRERIALGSPDGLIPLAAAADPDDATMWHPVLEFPAGLPAPLAGHAVAPAANRVLLHYDPVNADFRIDPGFDAALTDPALRIDALLISGFSQLAGRAALERVLWDTAVAVQIWRAARDDLVVHLELGAMPDAGAMLRILEVLQPVVTSVGLNVDELDQLLGALGETMAAPGPALVAQVRHLAARYPVPRFSLHTREFCLTVTDGDPERERDALLFGALVAATRARTGAFPAFADLAATLAEAPGMAWSSRPATATRGPWLRSGWATASPAACWRRPGGRPAAGSSRLTGRLHGDTACRRSLRT